MADGNMIISLLPPRRTILDKSPKMVGAVDKGDGQNGSLKSRDPSGSTSNLNWSTVTYQNWKVPDRPSLKATTIL